MIYLFSVWEKKDLIFFLNNRIKMEPFQTNQGCAAKKVLHMVRGVYLSLQKS